MPMEKRAVIAESLFGCASAPDPHPFPGGTTDPPGGAGRGTMWTGAHRARHDARPKEIVPLHAVGQVARWPGAHGGRPDARPKEIVPLHAVGQVARWPGRADPPPRGARAAPHAAGARALAWHPRAGGAWRAPRPGLVHRRTAYGRLRRWPAP